MTAQNSSGWFDIADAGWIRQQAGRPMEEIVRELVQNAFDAARSEVRIRIEWIERDVTVAVTDDGDGFLNPALAYTVFMSEKADDATRRGRKGRGLKEAIAAASDARVECINKTVRFEKSGRSRRRVEERNHRERGTYVELTSTRWSRKSIDETIAALRTYDPPMGVVVTVYTETLTFSAMGSTSFQMLPHDLVRTVPMRLQTVVTENEVEVRQTRDTTVRLLAVRDGETPMLYEMGIPVCAWEGMPWHVDVQQRIPLPDHRSTVPLAWERKLKTLLLDATAADLGAAGLKAEWVSTVLADAAPETRANYVSTVYGGNVAVKTVGDADSNAQAEEMLGKNVIDTRHLPVSVREALREFAPSTRDAVRKASGDDTANLPGPDDMQPDDAPADARRVRLEPRLDEAQVCALTSWIATKILGRRVNCWIEQDVVILGKRAAACFGGNNIVWSRHYSGKGRMDDPFGEWVLQIIIHEVAHGLTATWGHGPEFNAALERCAGRVARLLLLEGDKARAVVAAATAS